MEYAEKQLQQQVKERQKQMSEQALLPQDEKVVEEMHKKTEERVKACLEQKATELEKQRETERIRKEKRQKKQKEEEKDNEEDAPMIDDTDKDKDHDPDDDPEVQFVVKDQDLEDKDTFEVEKHVHALNFDEAGKYLVSTNRYMEAFVKIVQRGKDDVMKVNFVCTSFRGITPVVISWVTPRFHSDNKDKSLISRS